MASVDLLITNEDISINDIGEPHLTFGAACVAQDIRHMMIEEGFMTLFIAERNKVVIGTLEKNIEIAIEDDERIAAGSASVSFDGEIVHVAAKTIGDEPIYLEVLSG